MWKRERPERVDLEEAMAEPPAPPPAVRAVPLQPAAVTEAAPTPRVPTPTPQPVTRSSILGATLRFKGDLVADEDLVVEGQVEGSILHSRCLTIGALGRMCGDIRSRRIVVEGTVDGNLYALENVVLRPGARVHGDLFSPKVAIEDGAHLNGRIDMDKAPTVPKVKSSGQPSAEPASELSSKEVSDLLARQ